MSLHVSMPAVSRVVCTNANTEYSVALPKNAAEIRVQARAADVRIAFDHTGEVADAAVGIFWTVKAAQPPHIFGSWATPPRTLYVASTTGGAVLEVLVRS